MANKPRPGRSPKRRPPAQSRKKRAPRRKPAPAVTQDIPEVVYTPAPPMGRRKLLLHLATVVAVVVALMFCMTIFFRVDLDKTTVSGNNKYTAWEVLEASGIEEGEGLLTFSRIAACGRITTALPYIQDARISISLPDTVHIYVVEQEVTYAVESETGTWWLMSSEGRLIQQITPTAVSNYTKITGVKLAAPQVNATAQAVDLPPDATDASGESVIVTVTGAQKLRTALTILTELGKNGIIGDVASVNVANMGNLEVWYGNRYQVQLGDSNRLGYKVGFMAQAIAQMPDYQSGVLDVSFRLREDVILSQFE